MRAERPTTWRRSWLATSAAVLWACAVEPTEVVVVIDSDLPIPDTLGRVEMAAWSPRAEPLRTALDLESPDDLPRTLVLFPRTGESGRFSLSVIGLPSPDFRSVVVRRDVDAAFVPGQTRVLDLFLSAACAATWSTCGPGETCDAGRCRPVELDASELPRWQGEPPARTSACTPRPESCNDLDDDCDGDRDEDFDRASDADHCGVCGRACADGSCADGYCPNAVPVDVVAGSAHTCVRRRSGIVSCFGWNGAGQIGADSAEGDSLDAELPIDVALPDVAGASAGGAHTCAWQSSGATYCWGDNTHGELGDGTGRSSVAPVEVVDLRATDVAAGIAHTCAVTDAATVACWGDGADGQLGRPPSAGSAVPLEVPGLMGAEGIAVGAHHSCALVGGRAHCWGDNSEGQLGDGTTVSRAEPAPVAAETTDFTRVVAGRLHTCALRASGAVLCWGRNLEGQLGDGTRERRSSPVVASLPAGATAIAAAVGGAHTCAIVEGATVACWGANAAGQLGDGSTDDRALAVAVRGLSRVVAIAAGGEANGGGHTCAIDRSGAAYCWGRGGQYQTGTYYPLDETEPTPVEALPYRNLPSHAP
ncbi:MAG: hypothetical protein IT379_29020 [Deltaproteobacteria bacterium]|nr:hypothetical protein [Deltaproteobacteria bacterium]